jgi:hypothetical protein
VRAVHACAKLLDHLSANRPVALSAAAQIPARAMTPPTG